MEPERPNAVAARMIGLSEAEAIKQAEAVGHKVRVVSRDGQAIMGITNKSASRVNLRIENGLVVDAFIG